MTFLLDVPPRHQIGNDRDVRDTIEARHHAHAPSHNPERWGEGAAPDHFGPQAFGAVIRVAPYLRRLQPPTHISKYDSETNPHHGLEDYRLTMRVGGWMMTSPSSNLPCFYRT